jgi:hypothetical protein
MCVLWQSIYGFDSLTSKALASFANSGNGTVLLDIVDVRTDGALLWSSRGFSPWSLV